MFEGGVSTMRGRWSDELDFLLRQVEQAFTSKIKFENKVIIKQVFPSRRLVIDSQLGERLQCYNAKVKLRNYR